ncbi:Rho termination factor N-terminal domain-containing protein [Lysinibacillus xylanilyticus]|uniref:Rho termination factor N-terminal domain-containing protein n=1 Tax=Lysinibacillus xylanilyticus TaxID=582475 RepID=UPI003D06F423
MAKIYAPNKAYNGITATVRFINGEGNTDNPKLLKWFTKKGYSVEKVQTEELPEVEHNENVQVSVNNEPEQTSKTSSSNKYAAMNVDELKEIAKNLKVKGYSSMLRPQLIEALQAKESE